MALTVQKTPFAKKQIPTLLGLAILVFSLVAGVLLFRDGTGVFAPRATPQTTPKNPRISNITDRSFTVSFYTDEAVAGFVRYGTEETSLRSQASDDRDQLSGTTGQYMLHHITVRGLTPNTEYYYVLGTATVPRSDNNGAPFTVRTAVAPSGSPALNKTVYGTAATATGAPAEGSVVYVQADGMGELSSLVKASGSWALALSSAFAVDGSGYAQLNDETSLSFIIQGTDPTQVSLFSLPISEAQPAPEVTLGQAPAPRDPVVDVVGTDETGSEGGEEPDASDTMVEIPPPAEVPPGSLTGLLDSNSNQSAEATVLDLSQVTEEETPTVHAAPTIKGIAIPGATVTIEVHSETKVVQTLVANATGEFELNLEQLGTQLEPGEHTVTYSYTDPATGQLISRTQTFVVEDSTRQIAQADTGTTPFGSGNPFPVTTPTPTPEASPTPTPEATRAAVVATQSGTYTAGSVETTIALVLGGIFFIFAGSWSWWLAHETRQES